MSKFSRSLLKTVYIVFLFFCLSIALSSAVYGALIDVTLINQDPDPAIAGDVLEVRIGIENEGNSPTGDLILELVPSYPFEAISGEEYVQNTGSINAYQSGSDIKVIKYRLKVSNDVSSGTYDLNIKYSFSGSDDTTSVTKTLSIDIKSKESAEIIHIDQTVLIPGKQTPLAFTVTNVGSAALRDMTFSWSNPDKVILPVGSDNTKHIKYLDVGESKELSYQVMADSNSDSGLYLLDLNLLYYNSLSGVEEEINTIAGIYVGGTTDFDIAFSESTSSQTSFTIANIGSNPAFSVSVIIPSQNGWSTTGANSMIIGNLNTGDYTVASFSLSSKPVVSDINENPKNNINKTASLNTANPLKVQIAYTDTMGSREFIEKEVMINQQAASYGNMTLRSSNGPQSFQKQSFFSKYSVYIVALVVIILLILSIIYYTRYKKEKELNSSFRIKDLFIKKSSAKKK
ncbi:MAG: COG1361 S-layer family protein [Candidatus Woesearchaeota archaeon]